jgi:hypothetical protein
MFSPDQPGPGNIVKTQKQTNSLSRHVVEAGETLYEIAEPTADLNPKHSGTGANFPSAGAPFLHNSF